MTRQITAAIAALALLATTACGKSAEQEQAEKAAQAVADATKTGADQMAQGAAAMAQGLDQLTKGVAGVGTVEVLPFESLGEALPDVNGWQRGEIEGRSTNFPIKMSQSEVTYTNGDARINVEVMDTALNQMLVAPFSMYLVANYSERTSDGYRKGTTVKGEPAFEEVSNRDKTANITVVVGKRFIVNAKGQDVAGIEPVRAVLDKMDFKKLTAAK